MVAATDEHGHTSYAWGEFTTLSQRDVIVEFGDLTSTGGPNNITATMWRLGLDGPQKNITPGQQGILLYKDLPWIADLDFWVLRQWDCDIDQIWNPDPAVPQGHSNPACKAGNSTSIEVDLDTKPAGKTRWTSTTAQTTLRPPTAEGDELPPGHGDPYWFTFEVPVTLHVSYS